MRYLSVCSGIEAASVAWAPLGWCPVAFSEIEPFPCAVLAHHFPDVPNWGDMTKYQEWPDAAIDLLCGGTPCQSFSVAGLRAGLADPRGDLMLTFGAIAARYRPRWLVWENVPGVLSSNGGRDFGAFLGLLGELGYGFAYRVLDAQHFGVPQRRRRVFVVGCLGDWRRAAAVLFERHSLQGHPAPSRRAREDVAGTVAGGARKRGGFSLDDIPIAGTLKSRSGGGCGPGPDEAKQGMLIVEPNGVDCFNGALTGDVANTLTAGGMTDAFNPSVLTPAQDPAHSLGASPGAFRSYGEGQFNYVVSTAGDVAHALRGEGFDASEDGTGRGTPLVPVFVPEIAATMVARSSRGGGQTNSPGHQADHELIAFDSKASGRNGFGVGAVSPTLRAMGHKDSHSNAGGQVAMQLGMRIRRLTPTECERLQGLPDGWTNVLYRKKPAADGPRYRAIGNSWAVPCPAWIGRRIDAIQAIKELA